MDIENYIETRERIIRLGRIWEKYVGAKIGIFYTCYNGKEFITSGWHYEKSIDSSQCYIDFSIEDLEKFNMEIYEKYIRKLEEKIKEYKVNKKLNRIKNDF